MAELGGSTGIVVVQDSRAIAREQQPSDAELAELLSRTGPPGEVSVDQVAEHRATAERARSVDIYLLYRSLDRR